MMDLSRVGKYYVACGYTDLRRGIDGLAAMVTQQFGKELREDSLLLFCGRRTDRIKALYYSGDGYVLVYKRLNNGAFQWPRTAAELRRKLERMNELLLNAQRARFGQSSEKRSYVIPEQLGMFNEAEAEQDHKAPEPTEETLTVKEHQRKRKPKRTAEELIAGLPVKEIVLEFSEDERSCSTCGHPLKQIGKKFLYEELEIIPQQVRVLKYYSATYACENCEKKSGYAHIYSVKAPPRLIKHSLASPSTVANVMTRKYVDGLTLYRRLKKHLLESRIIYADETVVQVLKEDGKPASSESRMWVYGSGERGGRPIRFFEYQPDRSGKHAAAFLKGFIGCLVTDGYAGYSQVTGAVRCGC